MLSVIEDMQKGRLSLEAVEALRAVYPETYERIRIGLVSELATLRDELPYPKRIQLSIFFDVPVDSVLRREFVRSMQEQFVPAEEPEPGKAIQPEALSAPEPTEAQGLEAR
ncbi:MAG: hypothetical protein ACE5LB_14975 [Acidiferrobacterales bacterium]